MLIYDQTSTLAWRDWSKSADFVKEHLLPLISEYGLPMMPDYVGNVLEVYKRDDNNLLIELLVDHQRKEIFVFGKRKKTRS